MGLPENWLETLLAAYPKRRGDTGRGALKRLVPKAIADGATFDELLTAARNYAAFCTREGKVNTETVKMAATFYGRDCWWEEWLEEAKTPAEIAAEARWRQLEDRAMALGFTTVDRARGYSVALSAVEQAERQRDGQIARELRLVK